MKERTNLIVGFTLRRSFNVILHDLSQVEKFISVIMKNGANVIKSIDFRSSKEGELRNQARLKAVRYRRGRRGREG